MTVFPKSKFPVCPLIFLYPDSCTSNPKSSSLFALDKILEIVSLELLLDSSTTLLIESSVLEDDCLISSLLLDFAEPLDFVPGTEDEDLPLLDPSLELRMTVLDDDEDLTVLEEVEDLAFLLFHNHTPQEQTSSA